MTIPERIAKISKNISFSMYGKTDVLELKKGKRYKTSDVLMDGTVRVYDHGVMWLKIPSAFFGESVNGF